MTESSFQAAGPIVADFVGEIPGGVDVARVERRREQCRVHPLVGGVARRARWHPTRVIAAAILRSLDVPLSFPQLVQPARFEAG